jgi:hypothetical protein
MNTAIRFVSTFALGAVALTTMVAAKDPQATQTEKVMTAPAPTPKAPEDIMCNGFWCGYGDDKVCCHTDWRSCCRRPNSNSYYCCN